MCVKKKNSYLPHCTQQSIYCSYVHKAEVGAWLVLRTADSKAHCLLYVNFSHRTTFPNLVGRRARAGHETKTSHPGSVVLLRMRAKGFEF